MPDWLPEQISFSKDFSGDWESFFNHVYALFERDFVHDKPIYDGERLGLKRYPEHDGKSATFWHLISEGSIESERTPNIGRCERIEWPSSIINAVPNQHLKVWIEQRKGEDRIHIWLESENYLVVLNKRTNYILLWTAFHIEREHEKRKYEKRWLKYKS